VESRLNHSPVCRGKGTSDQNVLIQGLPLMIESWDNVVSMVTSYGSDGSHLKS
jgi:hypothetical protein